MEPHAGSSEEASGCGHLQDCFRMGKRVRPLPVQQMCERIECLTRGDDNNATRFGQQRTAAEAAAEEAEAKTMEDDELVRCVLVAALGNITSFQFIHLDWRGAFGQLLVFSTLLVVNLFNATHF
jgi:hypothetical protein